ncbi:TraV family lipoprotein, partial [Salmonella enterica]|nr:TraV family lipoprotein [Salmonella enterica]
MMPVKTLPTSMTTAGNSSAPVKLQVPVPAVSSTKAGTIKTLSSLSPTPKRKRRSREQTAALWIAPYIDSQDIYHQPSGVFF